VVDQRQDLLVRDRARFCHETMLPRQIVCYTPMIYATCTNWQEHIH
jgi:hypothetical protein